MYENYKVLFVDDDEYILASIKRCLIDEEFRSYFVTSGKEAIAFMEKNKVDVIVTDMRMPDMNGLQLLHIVTDRWPMVVKIVLTGFTQITQILATINQINLFKFLAKPWVNDELILILRQSLDIAKLLEDNERYKKMLEMQNKTFKTVIKESDEAVKFARDSVKILSTFGKSLISFGIDLPMLQKLKSSMIFSLKDELFENFSNAVPNSTAQYTASELSEILKNQIENLNPKAIVSCQQDANHELSVNVKILESVLYAIHLLFGEEFQANGVTVNIGMTESGSFTILIQSEIQSIDLADGSATAELFQMKVDFFVSCYRQALKLCKISLDSQLSEALVLSLSLMNDRGNGA